MERPAMLVVNKMDKKGSNEVFTQIKDAMKDWKGKSNNFDLINYFILVYLVDVHQKDFVSLYISSIFIWFLHHNPYC